MKNVKKMKGSELLEAHKKLTERITRLKHKISITQHFDSKIQLAIDESRLEDIDNEITRRRSQWD